MYIYINIYIFIVYLFNNMIVKIIILLKGLTILN